MKQLYLFLLLLLPCFLFAQQPSDWVFQNGKIYTVDAKTPWAEAVAVKDSMIVFVGKNQDCGKFIGDKTRVVDLQGRFLMPGFVDGHNHFLSGCAAKRGFSLVGIYGKEKMLERIKEYVIANPDNTVYLGYGWTFPAMGKVKINRHDLDNICRDKPIFIFNEDSHVVLFNTKTMEIAGVSKDTKDFSETSFYEREPDGTPSGIAVEDAAFMTLGLGIQIFGGKDMVEDIMNDIFPQLPKFGITSFYDMGINAPKLSDAYLGYELLQEWEKAGKLMHRVAGVLGIREADLSPKATIDTLKAWQKRYSSQLISIPGLKIWADGTPDTHTGVQLEPYLDKPETKGESPWTVPVLKDMIVCAYKSDIDVHIHAMGDGSIRRSLDAYELAEKLTDASKRRSALHHINVIHPDDLTRFKTLNISANATLEWLTTYWDQAYNLFTRDKVEKEYDIWYRLDSLGVNLTYGSDLPGTNPDEIYPFYQMEVAFTGKVPFMQAKHIRTPDRVPSLEQMIRGYTINGAYSMHMENRIGSVEKGKLADIIILDKNPFDVTYDQLSKIKVIFTMMNGKVTYQDN